MLDLSRTLPSRTVCAVLPALAIALALGVGAGAPAALAQSGNLLRNPGFERPYVALPNMENMRIAEGWTAWWVQGSPEETAQGYRLAPEYKAAFQNDFPYDRVRSGELSQQYFHSFGNFQGGVWQQVNVPPGSRLRFNIWNMAWSCDKEDKGNCPNATSGDPSPMHMRIGIDPTGGTDPFSPAIVWSPEQNPYDVWTESSVEAVAQGPRVTVFTYSYPDFRSQDNNVYLDDASLVVLGPAPKPTAPPAPTAAAPAPVKSQPAAVTPKPKPALPASSGMIYILGPKDTFVSVAQRFGVKLDDLLALNGLTGASQPKSGLKVKIPKSSP